MKPAGHRIFSISTAAEFSQLTLETFRYQAEANPVYRDFIGKLGIQLQDIRLITEIPFLPVSFFKTHRVISGTDKPEISFSSSGTTGTATSRHYVTEKAIYESSYLKGFEHFYGSPGDYCILALLPSYLEREGSSLIYMAEDLIRKSGHRDSGFYLHNYDVLISKLKELNRSGQKTLLLGVTYALLDLIETEKLELGEHIIVMETGGMKGRRREMIREELHALLTSGLGVRSIHSEYGMTELLSQAYSNGKGRFYCPPWMKILLRDPNDPLSPLPHERTGGINVIDLANINSCSFISTQDLGKTFSDNSFEVLGRFDNSDIRGCNLLIG